MFADFLSTHWRGIFLCYDGDMASAKKTFLIASQVWIYPGDAAWHFITVPRATADLIKKRYKGKERGFRSFRVKVKIGKSVWQTSIFPENESQTFLLPLKKEIRKKEQIFQGDTVDITLAVLV